MGYKVTRERLRQTIRSIDPLHTALRWRGGLTARRPYCVPGPNSLWHIGKLYDHDHHMLGLKECDGSQINLPVCTSSCKLQNQVSLNTKAPR